MLVLSAFSRQPAWPVKQRSGLLSTPSCDSSFFRLLSHGRALVGVFVPDCRTRRDQFVEPLCDSGRPTLVGRCKAIGAFNSSRCSRRIRPINRIVVLAHSSLSKFVESFVLCFSHTATTCARNAVTGRTHLLRRSRLSPVSSIS